MTREKQKKSCVIQRALMIMTRLINNLITKKFNLIEFQYRASINSFIFIRRNYDVDYYIQAKINHCLVSEIQTEQRNYGLN